MLHESYRTDGQRGIVLELTFTQALNEAIRRQARIPFDAGAYVRAIATLHANLPSTEEIVQRATVRASTRR